MSAVAGRVLLIPKGSYNSGITYNMLDVVTYEYDSYVAKTTTIGHDPTDTTYWQKMTDVGDDVNSLKETLTNETSARTSADALLQTQIDELVAPSGEAPSAAEVQNARIGADGVTYSTLGDAIRTQFTNSKYTFDELVDDLSNEMLPIFPNYELGKWIGNTGYDVGDTKRIRAEFSLPVGVSVNFNVDTGYLVHIGYFDSSDVWHFINGYASNFSVMNTDANNLYKIQISTTPTETDVTSISERASHLKIYFAPAYVDSTVILSEFNMFTSYPFSFAGIIDASGDYTSYPDNVYRVTDYIPASKDIFVIGSFGTVNSGYYNVAGYDENKVFVENIVRFSDSSKVSQRITLNAKTRYVRVMTTTSYVTGNGLFTYTGLVDWFISFMNDNTSIIKAAGKIIDSKYDYGKITEYANITNFSTVGAGYGIAITNLIPAGAIIEKIEFPNISESSEHYIIFVSSTNTVEKKFEITGKITQIDYCTESAGYLAYAVNSGASFPTPMAYKYNVNAETGFTSIKSHIFTLNSISEGDTIQNRSYSTTTINFVGCNIYAYEAKEETKKSDYAGKYISFLGDSITAGYTVVGGQSTFVSRPYPKTVASVFDCATQNKGYSSYPISSVGKPDCLLSVYQTISSDADYIVVFAGTNDLFYNVPIGTVADRTDISFCGAVYTLIDGLQTSYPNAQIVFMTPLHRMWEGPNEANPTAKLIDYVNAIKDVCGMCGVPVIDLYHSSYFNWVTNTSKAMLSDGLHPTQEGYDFLGKVVAQYLKNVLLP